MTYSGGDQTKFLTFCSAVKSFEDGLVLGILLQLQLLHAYACLIYCPPEFGRSRCNLKELAPAVMSFYLGNLHKIPSSGLLKWLAFWVFCCCFFFHANINIINIDCRLSFCLQSKLISVMVEVHIFAFTLKLSFSLDAVFTLRYSVM